MEAYMPISYLNDFIFCPRSIYFHQLYGRTSKSLYHRTAQTKGIAAHKTIDNKQYTTAKTVLQALEVYSDRYKLGGKIDTYDTKTQLLVERKKKIKTIYDGYIFQLYAQYYALQEMGYKVKQLALHSLDDNKRYPVALPSEDQKMKRKFDDLIDKMQEYDLSDDFVANENKCKYCIYSNLCDVAKC